MVMKARISRPAVVAVQIAESWYDVQAWCDYQDQKPVT